MCPGGGEIRIGCSGFSYDDWVGPFYPDGTPSSRFLESYAERFDTVEVNVTYYRMVPAATVASWVRRTPSRFLFAVKAHRLLTHDLDAPEAPAAPKQFVESIRPLTEAGRLGCVLMQFPNRFRPDTAAREHLQSLIDALAPLPLVCEFRSAPWAKETVWNWLGKRGVGWCCVDEPDLPGLMPRECRATSELAYMRFHGRNRAKWYDHTEAWERYDYSYSEAELAEWVDPIRRLAAEGRRALVYFNNHRMGQAPANAETFRQLIEAAAEPVD